MDTAGTIQASGVALVHDYLTNAMGDVYARLVDGCEEPVDPDEWGWISEGSEHRRSLEEVQTLPGFKVTVTSQPEIQRLPGPRGKRRRKGAGLLEWANGSAPPAIVESRFHAGGYHARLSTALGWAGSALPRNPGSTPFQVWDLLSGRYFRVDYKAVVAPGGLGCVYMLEDGLALKLGHTMGPPAIRLAALQTGNPRLLSTIAVIGQAGDEVEGHLHKVFDQWRIQGEWFDRNRLLAAAREHGGWKELLLHHLPSAEADWQVVVLPPYR